ncbi:MAG TPA: MBL fold metallo-hydrolase [Tepidisphaeraceae bacterium]|jgi:L-ascorbate metabolism protein UlaG (beta-lactamase superfamily)
MIGNGGYGLSSWRHFADWAKRKPFALKTADFLGRGRGRLRFLDHLHTPVACAVQPDLANWEKQELAACWVGHATVLLRVGGFTILTDPVLSNRVGLGLGLLTGGPKRLVGPALKVADLPKLDLILISHAHFDHLDRPTLTRLSKNTPVVTAPETGDLVRDLGFRNVAELRWGEKMNVRAMVEPLDRPPLTVTALEADHWGARTFFDMHRGYNAYLIESEKHKVLYGGDTAYHEVFKDLPRTDLAILGIGAYNPYVAAHATPEQAWQMANHARAERVLGMHHSTFKLSYEPIAEPLERLKTVAGKSVDRLICMDMGAVWLPR